MLGFLKGMLAAGWDSPIALFGYAGYTLNLLLDAEIRMGSIMVQRFLCMKPGFVPIRYG
jgi:hypothetical protein